MAEIGQIIDGKYEVLALIGQGGMSKVYLARDRRLNKQWAIKELQKRARDKNNEIVIQSAIAEANMIKQLDHPAIVRIVDIVDDADVIYIIEDYIEGETLGAILRTNGAQPQELVIEWGIQICEALEYLHTRKMPIIYRDMKPDNVMLKPDGSIKIIDFGIAREYKEQSLADTIVLGTKGYAAPEQYGGKGQTDARTDVYCLGVTLYHLVSGKSPAEPPYELYPIRHWNPQLSAGLEAIILKCTQLNPQDRYQSCAELLYALHHYEEFGAAYRAQQRKKLNTFIAFASTCLFCTLLGAFSLIMRTQTNNADYAQNIAKAQKAATSEEQVQYYSEAIDIKPYANEAYIGMIDAFKNDASFSVGEEEQFKQKILGNLTGLRAQKEYADLAFEIGKLYWYYYDYGRTQSSDNQITRIKSAVQWFDDVIQYGGESYPHYSMALIYRDVGIFNRDITLNVEEASDQGTYLPYWENISTLIEKASDEDNEIVELEAGKLAVYSVETYARKFKNDGVIKADMERLLKEVDSDVRRVATTSDKTTQLKEEIIFRLTAASEAVENAYR